MTTRDLREPRERRARRVDDTEVAVERDGGDPAVAGSVHESTFTVEGTTFLLIAPADYEILQPAMV